MLNKILKLVLLVWHQNIASCHPRLSGIGQRNTSNAEKDSGQAGMTKFRSLISGVLTTSLSILIIFLSCLTSLAGSISPDLEAVLQTSEPYDEIPVIITLSEKADLGLIRDWDKHPRRTKIIKALKDKADATQLPLKVFLGNRSAKKIISLWIINGIAASVPAWTISELAVFPGVESVAPDYITQAPPVTPEAAAAPEWNLTAVKAPDLWNSGFIGTGVVVANMDTGVDYLHPDLNIKWRGGTNSWYDPNGEHPNTPYDADGHGTGTMGIMVGGNAGGTSIGVAPGAQWIAVKIFNDAGDATDSAVHQGFQWLLDPDGNPATNDAPDVVNNSWGFYLNAGQCIPEFQQDIQALKSAGIAVVFAAGNSGPDPSTSESPANNPGSFSVGAVDNNSTIAWFSSRGPSACPFYGDFSPNIVAPGVGIRTSDLTFGGTVPNSYQLSNGTSFAAPHVAGAMALLLSAFPNATVSQLEDSLKQSAHDLGPAGPDNTFGYGMLDVTAAYNLFQPPTITVTTPNGGENLKAGSAYQITWTFTGFPGAMVRIDLLLNGVLTRTITAGTSIGTGGSGSYNWTVPSGRGVTYGGGYQIKVTSTGNSAYTDMSNSAFSITLAGGTSCTYTLTPDSANYTTAGGGGSFTVTTQAGCNWTATTADAWITVTPPNTGTGSGTVNYTAGGNSGGDRTGTITVGGQTFTITQQGIAPTITVTAPNGGENLKAGSMYLITWTYTGNPGTTVRIELLRNGLLNSTITYGASAGAGGNGSYSWTVPSGRGVTYGGGYQIKVTSTSNSAYTDVSNSTFNIVQ